MNTRNVYARHTRRLRAAMVAICIAASPTLAADGIWTLRERFCLTVNGDRGCSRGSEDFMLLGAIAYYREGDGDPWTEVGTVATKGKSVLVQVTRAGVARLVEDRTGVDITDRIDEYSFTYRARASGSSLSDGKIRVRLEFTYDGDTYRIRGGGTFRGRRIGDAYPVPPPDPYYGEFHSRTTDDGAGLLEALGERTGDGAHDDRSVRSE